MAARSKLKEIEVRQGMNMADILRLLYEQYDTQSSVADALGVSQSTISLWLRRLGLAEKTTLVKLDRMSERE